MTENDKSAKTSVPSDGKTAEAFTEAFETILASFPDDVSVLESLVMAYQENGQTERARERALRLGHLLAAQNQWQRVEELVARQLAITPNDPDFVGLRAEALEALESSSPAAAAVAPKGSQEAELAALQSDIRGELDLGWMLVEGGVITSDQYEKAVESLMENRSNVMGEGALSLLQELQSVKGMDMDSIVAFLSQKSETPFILLSRYEIDDALVQHIPMKYIRGLSVLPFGRLGKEIMIAVLNPVDQNLRKSLSSYLNTRVHFYFTSPEEFHTAMEAIRNRKAKKPGA